METRTEGYRILVMRAGAIGDFLVSLPAIGALGRAFPGWEVLVVGNGPAVPLARRPAYADEVRAFDEPWVSHLYRADGHASPDLRARLARVRRAVLWLRDADGLVADNLRRLGADVLVADPFPPPGARQHVADYLLSTLAPLGARVRPAVPKIDLRPDELAEGQRLSRDLGLSSASPVVAIHPGSGGFTKCWPADRFARLADTLHRGGRQVLVVSGPADERHTAEMLRAVRAVRPVVAAPPDLVALAGLLAHCALYVGNDSGVTHLSAALGIPTVAIFGPTDPSTWAPRGPRVELVAKPTECAPCSPQSRQVCPHRRCLRAVEFTDVLAAIQRLFPRIR